MTNIREEIGTKVLDRGTEYDALGRVKKETYPSGYYTVNTYDNDYGFLTEVKDKYGRQLWKAIQENARGQLTEVQRGGKTTTFGFDSKGLPTSIQSSGIVNMTYLFDNDGNLNYRTDNLTNQKEMFAYDGMNRLTNWNIYQNNVLVKPNSIVYNATTGTITSKSDLNNLVMSYGENGKPHALTSIEGVPANFPTDSLNVTYTDFKKIKTLTEGNKYYILAYGIDDQRRKSEYKINGVTQKTKYYLGDYEEETDNLGNIKKIHYLSGGAILINTNGVETLYYGYSDYQGSLIALTNDAGTVVERYAYDPWGARRNPTDWTQTDSRTSWIINRGYTMHEHLDVFGIINMNGRVYDPLTAMFFSPDPFVQAPGNWLNYNRYGYCMNNPLKYTDPNGEFWNIIIGAFIGGIVNWVSNGAEFTWEGLGYFGIGAAVGALSAVGGAWMATTFKAAGVFAGALIGATTGAITGGGSSILLNGGNNVLNGGAFFDNWQSNLKSGIINGAIGGAISGGIKGWKYAKSQGADPWTGEVKDSERAYQATIKTGVAPQQDPSKHCYSVADEYADKGHGNLSRNDFQNAAAAKNNGVIPDGADPGIVAQDAGLQANVAPMDGLQVDRIGEGMQKGSVEVMAVIGSDPTAGHAVNVVSFKVADRLNMFGGESTPFLKTSTMQIWNPISATVHRLTQSILKLEYIRY